MSDQDQELKAPMVWLLELPAEDYKRCCERFKSNPLSVEPTERRNALREAFFWGHQGLDTYAYFFQLNRRWMAGENIGNRW